MNWYAVYRYPQHFEEGSMSATGIHGPYTSSDRAYLKMEEVIEENPEAMPWDVYCTYTDNPREALLQFLAERREAYTGGSRGVLEE